MTWDNGFPTRYGRGLIGETVATLDRYVLVTQPEPLEIVQPQLAAAPIDTVFAGDLSPEHLDHLVATLPECDAIVGLGGGTAMDTAKWIHWRRGLPLTQIPSLPSVNACFTRMTALRDAGGVRYEGDAVPAEVIVDYELMWSADRAVVAGGIGDVLSCHTALHDWRLGDAAGRDAPWDQAGAIASAAYIDELEALAPLLGAGADEGLRRLMECHRDIGWRCHEMAHARFEEGSEHFFAYAFEVVTGRTILHGELVALGVLVMSAIQGNDPERAQRIVAASGMRHRLADLGVLWSEVEASLRRLPSFVEEQGLWWSAANGLVVDDSVIATAAAALDW